MNTKYEKVPYIITGKDLDYLSDMFNWNYGAYKMSVNSNQNIIDEEIKTVFSKASNVFNDSMLKVLNILTSGGNNE